MGSRSLALWSSFSGHFEGVQASFPLVVLSVGWKVIEMGVLLLLYTKIRETNRAWLVGGIAIVEGIRVHGRIAGSWAPKETDGMVALAKGLILAHSLLSLRSPVTTKSTPQNPRPYEWLDKYKNPVLESRDSDYSTTKIDLTQEEKNVRDKIVGGLLGLAIGDSLGAPFEFKSSNNVPSDLNHFHSGKAKIISGSKEKIHKGKYSYPKKDIDLPPGCGTDDTSMTLCTAASLLMRKGFDPSDMLVRYAKWSFEGYMAFLSQSFGHQEATIQALDDFTAKWSKAWGLSTGPLLLGSTVDDLMLRAPSFEFKCGVSENRGNGALMRILPIPLFFPQLKDVVKYSIQNSRLTHPSTESIDACVYYAGAVHHLLNGGERNAIWNRDLYKKLGKSHNFAQGTIGEILKYVELNNGEEKYRNLRGTALETLKTVIWIFKTYQKSKEGLVKAVQLGGDTDTVAALYGGLAGVEKGSNLLPPALKKELFQKDLIEYLAKELSIGRFIQERKSKWM